MSLSSLTALSLTTPVTPPAAAAKTVAPADMTHATQFAQIMSRGKPAGKDGHDSAKPAADKTDKDSQDRGDSTADASPSSTTDAKTVATTTQDDLNDAANQGISAVLALLGSIQAPPPPPAPATPPLSGTDVVADVASTDATTPARLFTTATPAVETPAPPAAPAPAPTAVDAAPVELAQLSPAELQLLRGVKATPATDTKTTAADGASTDQTASAPDISSMAKALHQAFGQTPPQPAPPAAQAAPADPKAALAPPPAADTKALIDKPATKDAKAADDDTAPALGVAAGDAPLPAFTLPASDTPVSAVTTLSSTTTGIAPTQSEQSVTRHLDLLKDTQWLDRLAQDIKQAATQNGHLKFQLNPEHLGSLAVEVTNSAAGTSIRMTADNDNARAIIADAQPRLLAEVRAQGLRVAESHVDLGNQASNGGFAGQRQSSEDHKPFVRTQVSMSEEPSDSAPRDDELYA